MADLLDPPSWKLGTADLIQQMATLVWLHKGDDHKDMLKLVTQARVFYELYNRVSSERDIEAYQQQCILGIVEYIQKHPKASETELTKEVQKQVELFQQRMDAL